jgi:hypothetical protein
VGKTKRSLIPVAAVLASLWAAAPGYAAGETFKVLSVATTGCANGNFSLMVERANLDGGAYTVHTVVTIDGLIYMSEGASISVNGTTGWSLLNNFSYGAVPNPGTWPMPANRQLRIDFTLERPTGTILHAWTTVADGCNTGALEYNRLTSDDLDKDLVAIPTDHCPTVAAATANGCPVLARTLTIAYDTKAHRFFGWLYAKGYPKLYSHRAVTIWKVRPGPDKRIGRVRTTTRGNYALARVRQRGVYYATAAARLLPASGFAPTEKSLNLRLR